MPARGQPRGNRRCRDTGAELRRAAPRHTHRAGPRLRLAHPVQDPRSLGWAVQPQRSEVPMEALRDAQPQTAVLPAHWKVLTPRDRKSTKIAFLGMHLA